MFNHKFLLKFTFVCVQDQHQHMKNYHKEIPLFNCDHCGKQFNFSRKLVKHKNKVHIEPKF